MLLFVQSYHITAKTSSAIQIEPKEIDLGNIRNETGPILCTFTLFNDSDKPITIRNVCSTCGCTQSEWTREVIQSGSEGLIRVTYSNKDRPGFFSKILLVYLSDNKMITLKISGNVITDVFAKHSFELELGPLRFKSERILLCVFPNGIRYSVETEVFNSSTKPVQLEFDCLSPSFIINSATVYPKSVSTLHLIISSTPSQYGETNYVATPIING